MIIPKARVPTYDAIKSQHTYFKNDKVLQRSYMPTFYLSNSFLYYLPIKQVLASACSGSLGREAVWQGRGAKGKETWAAMGHRESRHPSDGKWGDWIRWLLMSLIRTCSSSKTQWLYNFEGQPLFSLGSSTVKVLFHICCWPYLALSSGE